MMKPPTLHELRADLHLDLSPALLEGLAAHGIHTLDDIRRAGRLPPLDGKPQARAVLSALEAQAQLSVLPTTVATNTKIIDAGFTSFARIADAPRARFASALGGAVSPEDAAAIHAAATAQIHALNNVITGLRIDAIGATASSAAAISAAAPPTCGCENCRNATSPMAYLADLLDFCLRRLKNNGAYVTLTFLQARFHQPFRDLPATCAAMETTLRQVRLCIEVLRGYVPAPDGAATSQWYLETAYTSLLRAIGTSFDEVRRMRAVSDPNRRQALAQRLGVALSPGRALPNTPDELDRLFLDTDLRTPAGATWPFKLSEAQLEQLFGLRDTHRPPLDPDPPAEVLAWRRRYLRDTWHEQDRSATSPMGEAPIIDPDVISEADLLDTTPAGTPRSARPQNTWAPLDFLEDRRSWIATTILELRTRREAAGLAALLDDLQNNVFFVGSTGMEGITVPVLLQLLRRQAAEDIASDLAALRLDQDAFSYLAQIAELDRRSIVILDSEWNELYSLILGRIKRFAFSSAWREQEARMRTPPVRNSGIVLSPDFFRVRAASIPGGTLAWTPMRWRSTDAVRNRWEDTLRARIDQQDAVESGLASAVDATEGLVLVHLRDELRISAGLRGNPNWRTPSRLTGYLQIDVEAGGCERTTRVAQAIETIQGLLFGARNGLLEDDALTLEDEHFDEAWQWIGSYETWRAAMAVFLHPEVALRPTLRPRRTVAFDVMVDNLRNIRGQVTGADAAREAAAYAAYFADVCSLTPVALCQTQAPLPGSATPADVLAIGVGRSGATYYSTWKLLPGYGYTGSPSQSLWARVAGLDNAVEATGIFPYQPTPGDLRIALFARGLVGGVQKVLSTSYDGAEFASGLDADAAPALLRSAEYDAGVVPVSAALAAAGVAPWTLSGTDQVVVADVDGDGRSEIVVLAGSSNAVGARRAAVIRERDGGLYVDAVTTNAGLRGWEVVNPDRPILFSSAILVVNPGAAGGAQIATLRLNGATLEIVNPTRTIAGGGGGSWTVALGTAVDPTLMVAANIDGTGRKLVILEHSIAPPPDADLIMTMATVLDWDANARAFTFRSRSEVSHAGGRISAARPVAVLSSLGPSGSVGDPREDIVIHCTIRDRVITGDGQTTTISHDIKYRFQLLRWNPATQTFIINRQDFFPNPIPGAGPAQKNWPMSADDRFVAVGGRTFPFRQSVVITSATRRAVGLLQYAANGSLVVAWHKEGAVESADGSGDTWDFRSDDRIVTAQLLGDADPEIVVMNPTLRLGAVIGLLSNATLTVKWLAPGIVPMPVAKGTQGWLIDANSRYLAGDLDRDGLEEIVVVSLRAQGSRIGVLRAVPGTMPRTGLASPSRFGPYGVTALDIASGYSRAEATQRRDDIAAAYRANSDTDGQGVVTYRPQHLPYLDEAYYFVPVELALRLRESGHYTDALDWLRSVYDYDRPANDRKIAFKLVMDAGEPSFERAVDWLLDPLTPHAIAETRRNSFTKFTTLSIVRTLIDFADREFTRGTSESVPRARELYLTALELLDSPEMAEHSRECSDLIGTLNLRIGKDEVIWIKQNIGDSLHTIRSVHTLSTLVKKLQPLLAPGDGASARLREAQAMVANTVKAERAAAAPTFGAVLEAQSKATGEVSVAMLAEEGVATRLSSLGTAVREMARARRPGAYRYIPAPSLAFCIPPNPALQALRRHAELCLHKIRTCRNIAGLETHLEPYAASAAADAAFASFNEGDSLPAMPLQNFQPLPYRYAVLIERTKQLVELARQMESSMLSFLASADQEKYQEIKARQDLALTQAALRLKDVQLLQADDGITAAQLQRDRAQLQADTYRGRLAAGLSTWETMALVAQHAAVAHLHTSAAITEASTFGIGGIGEVGQALAATSQVFQMHASFERREQEWRTDLELADQDVRIGQQQIRLAQDQAQVVGQERAIAALQVSHAAEILDFLTTKKLTGHDLYEWMGGVVEQVYRFFLQQATSTAQLAERQLAFERQEIVSTFIQADYWEPPAQGQTPDFSPPVNGLAVDLRGLTGSARLLRDVYQLDQHAFLKNQRKLQLTETISLSQLDPFAFEQLRQSGVMVFSTPMRLFDLKFPGHYLRLIKRVRTSVIALIPPTHGIRATLATTGTSRVVIGNDLFDTVTIQRGPEAVSLSSPINATGVFELDPQPELLVTFEGMGVDATWQLRLPKAANPFDYRTMADVLVSIDYTALDSSDYRERVTATLDRGVSFDRGFSLRQQFPDPWYDLHNPDQATPPAMTVRFRTERDDFPPNIEDLRIQQVALYVARRGGDAFGSSFATTLQFAEAGGGAAVGGLADTTETTRSTRRGNASTWLPMIGKSPVGEWTLALADTAQTRGYFDNDDIEDILVVITYGGRTPAWPE